MLLMRTDCIKAQFITSVIDPRDHEYVIGATLAVESLSTALCKAMESGETDFVKVRAAWEKTAGLMTFDDAVKLQATTEQYKEYELLILFPTNLSQRRIAAKRVIGKDVFFDWELPRSREGQYMYKWTVKGVTERCLAAAPLGDLSWPRMDFPGNNPLLGTERSFDSFLDLAILEAVHGALRTINPQQLFGYGYSNAYDWEGNNFSESDIKEFPSKVARLGAVWQIQPTWVMQGVRHYANRCAKLLKEEGIAGYVREIQKPALAEGRNGLEMNGAYLTDAYFETIAAQDIKM